MRRRQCASQKKKEKENSKAPSPYIFDPQFWLVLCYKRAEISIGFPFAFMIANTPLFAPNCSEETAAKAQKKQAKKENKFSFPPLSPGKTMTQDTSRCH